MKLAFRGINHKIEVILTFFRQHFVRKLSAMTYLYF
jgi:hypothetical protein